VNASVTTARAASDVANAARESARDLALKVAETQGENRSLRTMNAELREAHQAAVAKLDKATRDWEARIAEVEARLARVSEQRERGDMRLAAQGAVLKTEMERLSSAVVTLANGGSIADSGLPAVAAPAGSSTTGSTA